MKVQVLLSALFVTLREDNGAVANDQLPHKEHCWNWLSCNLHFGSKKEEMICRDQAERMLYNHFQ